MKKVVSLLLVLVLALSMTTVAFAAAAKPIAVSDDLKAKDLSTQGGDWTDAPQSWNSLKLGEEWVYEFLGEDFVWEDGPASPTDASEFTTKEISRGNVRVVSKIVSGKALVDEIKIDKSSSSATTNAKGGAAALMVILNDVVLVTSDKDIDLEIELGLRVGSKSADGTPSDQWTITGTYVLDDNKMLLEPETDDEGDDTSEGQLVKPKGYNPNWVAILDDDGTVEATMKLFKGRNFYIRAVSEIKETDAETADYYGFDQIVTMSYSPNAVTSVQKINFIDLGDQFVYGSKTGAALKSKADIAKDLVLLGTTADDLPLYGKYYLAATQVDVEFEEEILDEPTTDAPEISEDLGGDGYTPNVNDNPGTGK